MQGHDWNDLRHFLALHRGGTLAGAARAAGVNGTTVARRIAALEQALAAALFCRDASGVRCLTDTGRRVAALAEEVEHRHLALVEAAGQAAEAARGTVRLSSVPALVNRVLAPRLGALLAAHPELTVELVPEARNTDLSRREADLALRFSRPRQGGLKTLARKLGEMRFAVYRPAGAAADELGWIGYDEAHATLPQARWLARRHPAASLRVADLDTAVEAVAAGLGRTLLPRLIGDADPRLARQEAPKGPPPPRRAVWLLWHAEDLPRRSVGALRDWLTAVPWDSP